jgi:hypothetical protein
MRFLWLLLLIAAGTVLAIYAVGLSERCCASICPLAVEESWIYSSPNRCVEGAQYADHDGHPSLCRDVFDSGCRDRLVWNLYLALIRDLRFTA